MNLAAYIQSEPGVLTLIGLVIMLMAIFIPTPAKYFSETEIGF